MRELTVQQVLILLAHKQLDQLEASGRTLKDEQAWKDKLKKAEERIQQRRQQMDALQGEGKSKEELMQNLTERMRKYDEEKKKALEKMEQDGLLEKNVSQIGMNHG